MLLIDHQSGLFQVVKDLTCRNCAPTPLLIESDLKARQVANEHETLDSQR